MTFLVSVQALLCLNDLVADALELVPDSLECPLHLEEASLLTTSGVKKQRQACLYSARVNECTTFRTYSNRLRFSECGALQSCHRVRYLERAARLHGFL